MAISVLAFVWLFHFPVFENEEANQTGKPEEQSNIQKSRQVESKRLENKAHNAKILSLIAEKQNEELKTKSISDLKKLLK